KMHLDMAVSSRTQRQENTTKGLQYVTDVIAEIRRLANGLVKPLLGSVGIFEILRSFIAEVSLSQKLRIRFSVLSIVQQEMNEQLQETIYRIVQVHINNMVERSASKASIRISKENNDVILEITDDGRSKHAAAEKKAVLATIKSRAALVQGSAKTESNRKKGYILTVTLPLTGTRNATVRKRKTKREGYLPAVS
ncbi:MAG: hypothetical protein ABW007_23785, partial [Chitinophagaceae bacterium]